MGEIVVINLYIVRFINGDCVIVSFVFVFEVIGIFFNYCGVCLFDVMNMYIVNDYVVYVLNGYGVFFGDVYIGIMFVYGFVVLYDEFVFKFDVYVLVEDDLQWFGLYCVIVKCVWCRVDNVVVVVVCYNIDFVSFVVYGIFIEFDGIVC